MAYRDDYENDDAHGSAHVNDSAQPSDRKCLSSASSENGGHRYAGSYDYDGPIDNRSEDAAGMEVVFEQEQTGNAGIKKSIGSACQESFADFSWMWPIGVAIISIVVSWIVSMAFPMVQAVLPAEGPTKILVLGIMAFIPVLLILVVGVMVGIKLWMMYWRLPSNVDYRYADFKEKEEELRKNLRKKYLGYFKKRKGYGQIIGPDAHKMVDALLDPSHDCDINIKEWFVKYKEFQDKLIEQAKRVRNKYAMAVGAFTAFSRQSKLDAACVFFFSTLMVFEMAKIFNKRMSKFGALKTVILYSVNIFAASQIQTMGRGVVKVVCMGVGAVVGALLGPTALASAVDGAKAGVEVGDTVAEVAGAAIEFGINKRLAEQLGDRAIKEFVAVKY